MVKLESLQGNKLYFDDDTCLDLEGRNFKDAKFRIKLMLEYDEITLSEYSRIIKVLCNYYNKAEAIKKVKTYLKRYNIPFKTMKMQYENEGILIEANNSYDIIARAYIERYKALYYEYRCNYEHLLIW